MKNVQQRQHIKNEYVCKLGFYYILCIEYSIDDHKVATIYLKVFHITQTYSFLVVVTVFIELHTFNENISYSKFKAFQFFIIYNNTNNSSVLVFSKYYLFKICMSHAFLGFMYSLIVSKSSKPKVRNKLLILSKPRLFFLFIVQVYFKTMFSQGTNLRRSHVV